MKSFSLGSNPSRATIMKQCAIVLNGTDVISVSNLKRKYNKIINNPQMKILEECDSENLEKQLLFWKNKFQKSEAENTDSSIKYYFRNKTTGGTLVSIYNNLDNLKKDININDYEFIGIN